MNVKYVNSKYALQHFHSGGEFWAKQQNPVYISIQADKHCTIEISVHDMYSLQEKAKASARARSTVQQAQARQANEQLE